MRILFLSQWFQPEPFFKGLPFAKALTERGHHVEVLTGFPNYPGGKVYSGYRVRPHQRERMDGISVHRVALYPSHDKSAFRRIVNYLSFSISTFLLGPWLVGKADVIYVYNLVTLGPCGFLLRLFFGSKVIIDVQDLWPESITNSKMLKNKILTNILNQICKWVYQKADKLIVLSPGFKRELVKRGIKPEKIEVIYNWFDESSMNNNALPSGLAKDLGSNGKFIVLFAGTMGTVQGLDTLLECARICRGELPNVQFIMIGGGVDKPRLQQRSKAMGLNNVTFLPPRPMEAMGEIFAMADVLLVHLKDDPLFRITIPSKTQAYLYMGKPIIMAVRGDAAELVRKAGAGIVCEPDNPQNLVQAVDTLYEMSDIERRKMGEAGHRYYMENLSLHQGVKKFEQIISSSSWKAA